MKKPKQQSADGAMMDEDIHNSAVQFVSRWKGRGHESGETQLFYRDLFSIFGVKLENEPEAIFEAPTTRIRDGNLGRGFVDLLWKGKLLVEQKSRGENLKAAVKQALSYHLTEPTPYLLVSNFDEFRLYDLKARRKHSFALNDLPEYIHLFREIVAEEKPPTEEEREQANEEATGLLSDLCDELEQRGHDESEMARFLVRLVFCLFADNTDIFRLQNATEENRRTSKGRFWRFITKQARLGVGEIHTSIEKLFSVLNAPEETPDGKLWRERHVSDEMRQFPYINGKLFDDDNEVPVFNEVMAEKLLQACRFRWSKMSPAIFGSLFQFIMGKDRRRKLGGHYTTEENILKVIGPLFLDDLKKEFEDICKRKGSGRDKALREFRQRLGEMKFLDPACGCGNFLVITYRELRLLEMRVLDEIYPDRNLGLLNPEDYSLLRVHQFYGIEIDEFSKRIAETALWMMDHQLNQQLGRRFGVPFARIPLKDTPHITKANALRIDWNEVLPSEECSYVLGNPPFEGFARSDDRERSDDLRRIAKDYGNGGRRIDHVAAWFLKAAAYIQSGSAKVGFVATDSITQGEHPSQLWSPLLDRWNLEISFAYMPFGWTSDIEDKAQVRVVIIGVQKTGSGKRAKQLVTHLSEGKNPTLHTDTPRHISPYLFPTSSWRASRIIVQREQEPINRMPSIRVGSKPVDGGHYIFDEKGMEALLEREPQAEDLLRSYVGGREFLSGKKRWILYFGDLSEEKIAAKYPECYRQVQKVREYRNSSRSGNLGATIANIPTRYHVVNVPKRKFFVIPEVSSSTMRYIPMGWMDPPVIPSNKLYVSQDIELEHSALLMSNFHMVWVRTISGQLGGNPSYSPGFGYNNFPVPKDWQGSREELRVLAQGILDARENCGLSCALGGLYRNMPQVLERAHEKLDRAVDGLYLTSLSSKRTRPFVSNAERAEHLLLLYERTRELSLSEGRAPKPKTKVRRRPKKG
ncbi:MAG: class I SAM-dependent DNA methyltransferase [Rhodobacteraceae bacterium]|nr:class I SAM-dependent DNA methyltransferase [Paracoccaceae bacterium]